MNSYTPKQIAIITSLLIAGLVLVVLNLYHTILDSIDATFVWIICAVIIFGISYLIQSYFIRKYIESKINRIYKLIYNPTATNQHSNEPANLEEAEKDAENWVKHKEEESQHLNRLEQYRKEFLANVSHELRTPIFNIQGYLETLIDGGFDDGEISREYVYKAAKNTDRLSAIIDDLATISLIESGIMSLEFSKFNLHDLIIDVMESLEIKATAAEIVLKFDEKTNHGYMVESDLERIRQVLINLIFNSIKYGRTGGSSTISCYEVGNKILIEIADNGIGIEQEHLPRLFERFYRADTNRSREIGGTGLGLAIVKHILETHEQTINVRSTIGKGSTFSFTLNKA
ncbi:MAG: sensor histidine kinase [Flavobacteriales bacterium]|nr:sensor histidine kinase [Flavobacteriales bacterium]